MRVNEPWMLVPMAMWHRIGNRRIMRSVRMLMVPVMHVRMVVLRRTVGVFVYVPLRHMEPNTCPHERGSGNKFRSDRILPQDERKNRPNEGCDREVGPGPSRPEKA